MKKNEKDNKKDQKVKKEKHPVRNTLVVVLLLSALFGGGYGANQMGWLDLGQLGIGDSKESTEATAASEEASSAVMTTAETTESVTETVAETAAALKLVIEISDSSILVGDKTFADEKELKAHIMSVYEDGMEIELVDSKAVKATYDSAKSVLDDLGYKYAESTR